MNNVKDNQMLSKFREDHRGPITPCSQPWKKGKLLHIFMSLLREAIIKRYFFQSLSLQLAFEKLIQIVWRDTPPFFI